MLSLAIDKDNCTLYKSRVASGMVASAGVLATLPFKRGARAYLTFVCPGTKWK